MAQSNRQVRMFAAEDYFAVYDSYINANLQAFDFQTIRDSMITYIQAQYPENFNDWIESSDFVALLDVVAQFGHNLAFRNDLNSRNNFLSTAQRQDSVFKLAEFIGYVPRRNTPATGELKIISVKTNENVLGSNGTTLAGKDVRFENTSNNNIDDFISIMNAAFNNSNQFGNPRKSALVNGITTEFYMMENLVNQIVFEFTGVVQGQSKPFNAYAQTYNSSRGIVEEQTPNPNGAFSVTYKNDGRGLTSKETGFFIGVKQGSLSFKDFSIDASVSNMTLDVNVSNINNDDVWVQTINETGNVVKNWTKVQNINSFNEMYNDISRVNRDIFSVKTRADNQVSILFPDENFGNLPTGLIRVWYRTGVNQSYVLRTDDIGNKKVNIKYKGADGNTYTLTASVVLKSNVTNASASESLDDIRENAPRAYTAQNRLITADDYNNFLITQSTQISKVKCINRTHSGHSRYINPSDPTGKYSNLRLFGTDGKIEIDKTIQENNTGKLSSESIFDKFIKTQLDNQELVNLYYHMFKLTFDQKKASDPDVYSWQPIDNTSGYFTNSSNNIVSNTDQTKLMSLVKLGSILKLVHSINGTVQWAKVINISNNGLGVDNTLSGTPSGLNHRGAGAITLDREVRGEHTLEIVYSPFPRQFTKSERTTIVEYLKNSISFAIYYDPFTLELKFDTSNRDQNEAWPLVFSNNPQSWLIYCEHDESSDSYNIIPRVLKYKITSEQLEFSNISNEYKLDYHTNKKKRDTVDIIINGTTHQSFYIYGYNFDKNGVFYSNSVNLVLEDADSDQRPDNPELYYDLSLLNQTLTDLRFEWKHVPDNNEIIDPSFSNIIDAFLLTKSYDNEYRNWLIKTDDSLLNEPLSPTSKELTDQFQLITDKKAVSDTVIYRPVKYKVLFGAKATDDVRAKFSVIKSIGSTLTENEIKSRIVNAVYDFFDISNWDFGETFYFTELAAYVHKQLSGEISSFVIVPESTNSVFGKLFQITPMSDELFIPDVSLNDIDIVETITSENIKAVGY